MNVPAEPVAPEPPAEAPEFVPPPVGRKSPASDVPAKAAPPPARPQPKPEMWFLKSEEGEDFGPVPKSELDAWHAEGRITADCQLLREGSDEWQWAGEVFADLNDDAGTKPAPAVSTPAKSNPSASAKDDGPSSTRLRIVAGLLGIFLGPLGIHRFYLGYWVLGLAMLATGGGCGIWSLIDAVLVLLGKVPDADGRRLA